MATGRATKPDSLGGFWATWIAEQHGLRAGLINPAVDPGGLSPDYVGVELQNYHNQDVVVLSPADIELLCRLVPARISDPENYYLMAQTGDEILDYRLAVEKYTGCRQLIEEGGDHGYQGFDRHIPAAIDFLAPRVT